MFKKILYLFLVFVLIFMGVKYSKQVTQKKNNLSKNKTQIRQNTNQKEKKNEVDSKGTEEKQSESSKQNTNEEINEKQSTNKTQSSNSSASSPKGIGGLNVQNNSSSVPKNENVQTDSNPSNEQETPNPDEIDTNHILYSNHHGQITENCEEKGFKMQIENPDMGSFSCVPVYTVSGKIKGYYLDIH